jgi:hypothetical protein
LPLVERWFGRVNSWGLQSAPKPGGADEASFAGLPSGAGVSCPDVRACFAVGWFGVPSNLSFFTLAERRIGSSWSVMPTPNGEPYQGSQGPVFNTALNAVSCPARRACHAVGYGQLPTGDSRTIDERFDGASWHLETIPGGADQGVSCPSRFFCMAVGHGPPNGAQGTTGAAKWTP